MKDNKVLSISFDKNISFDISALVTTYLNGSELSEGFISSLKLEISETTSIFEIEVVYDNEDKKRYLEARWNAIQKLIPGLVVTLKEI